MVVLLLLFEPDLGLSGEYDRLIWSGSIPGAKIASGPLLPNEAA
jgi:hypothetical protein